MSEPERTCEYCESDLTGYAEDYPCCSEAVAAALRERIAELTAENERLEAENGRVRADIDNAYDLIVDGDVAAGIRVLYCTPDPDEPLARRARAPTPEDSDGT